MNPIIEEKDNLKTVSPLWQYANKLREVLKDNPDTLVGVNEDERIVIVKVTDERRWRALKAVLPEKLTFGGEEEILTIDVQLEHAGGPGYLPDSLLDAFKGNPHFHYLYTWDDGTMSNPMCWVTTDPDVLVYPESNLHQIYGDTVVLRADATHEVLSKKTDFIYYCADTNSEEKVRPIPDHNTWKFND